MNGSVFISGGGNANETYKLDKVFVQSLPNKNILYLPIGLKRDIVGFEGCYEWITNTLQPFSTSPINIEMWVNLKNLSRGDLDKFDGVYIGGANNTFRLMQILKKDNVDKLLQNFVSNGGMIYGGSSGGIILGENIDICGDENEKDFPIDGLNLINGFSIYCHYNLSGSGEAREYAIKNKSSVIAIPENSGIVINNKIVKVVGLSSVELFYEDGRTFLLKNGQEMML